MLRFLPPHRPRCSPGAAGAAPRLPLFTVSIPYPRNDRPERRSARLPPKRECPASEVRAPDVSANPGVDRKIPHLEPVFPGKIERSKAATASQWRRLQHSLMLSPFRRADNLTILLVAKGPRSRPQRRRQRPDMKPRKSPMTTATGGRVWKQVKSPRWPCSNVRTSPEYRYAMGLAAPLVFGWTLLLVWGDRKLIARRGILALTCFL